MLAEEHYRAKTDIGGYFGLELTKRDEYHSNALKLNSGRNALKLVLREKLINSIYLPLYICDTVVQAIKETGTPYKFYKINDRFEPILPRQLHPKAIILFVNYFGLNDDTVRHLAEIHSNLVIDNSQAFFSQPGRALATFYSPRKFFGVTDGGYLYTDQKISDEGLEEDISYERYQYALIRLDSAAEQGYQYFRKNEHDMANQPIRKMSKLTEKILASIDYDQVKRVRERNFLYLHRFLEPYNELELNIDNLNGPMIYPFLIAIDGLREFLIGKRIFVARYWSAVLNRTMSGSFEYRLVKHLVPLPIDQRYSLLDMDRIISWVTNYLSLMQPARNRIGAQ